jgi:REP element-mobilizing transposase RayT
MQKRQLLLSQTFKPRLEHGGAIRAGKRKLSRPIDPKRAMHLVMRAEVAKNRLSLLPHARAIETLARRLAKRYRVRIYRYVNAGNHIHAIVRPNKRKGLQDFLRVFAGKVAQLVTGAKKGRRFGRFWDALAFTRIASWGKAYRVLRDYLDLNEFEVAGIFGFRKPTTRNALATRSLASFQNRI